MPARAEPHSPMLDTGAMLALAALGPRWPAVTLWANSGKACAGRNSLLKGAVGDVAIGRARITRRYHYRLRYAGGKTCARPKGKKKGLRRLTQAHRRSVILS
jgi:hypothetical protein